MNTQQDSRESTSGLFNALSGIERQGMIVENMASILFRVAEGFEHNEVATGPSDYEALKHISLLLNECADEIDKDTQAAFRGMRKLKGIEEPEKLTGGGANER